MPYGERAMPPFERAVPRVEHGPWALLGVAPGAAADEIKRAYRRLARSVHPDLHPGASAEERRALELRFAQLTEAYRRLVA
jgi:curved DNA-binding protein CbpA